jgi:hypothetical protein
MERSDLLIDVNLSIVQTDAVKKTLEGLSVISSDGYFDI